MRSDRKDNEQYDPCRALAIGVASGIDGRLLYETLSKGSSDSFALRNHGMKAILPGIFPREAFSTRYAMKDLDSALALAKNTKITPRDLARTIFRLSVR